MAVPTVCRVGDCEQACELRGDAKACAGAAELYLDGRLGRGFDLAKALRYAMRGCDGGDADACALLGALHENALGVAWGPETAIVLGNKACEGGAPLGCQMLAEMFSAGHGVDPSSARARTYWARAHTLWLAGCQGDEPRVCPWAAATAGRDDAPAAREIDRRACERGVDASCVALASRDLVPGPRGDAALRELDRLCDGGAPVACRLLAAVASYTRARGRDDPWRDRRSHARAAELTLRSCELQDPEGCVSAGLLHDGKEPGESRRALGFGCDHGAGDGCFFLAEAAAQRDPAQAEALAQRGCQLGNVESCRMLAGARAAAHDDAAAIRWATEACRLGSHPSCSELIAHDVALSDSLAARNRGLYREACESGREPACRRLAKLDSDTEAMLHRMLDAIDRRDVAAFATLAPGDIDLVRVWFPSPGCAALAGNRVVGSAQQPALLACLAELALQVAPPSRLGEPPMLTYEPGGKLEVQFDDGAIQWIHGPPISVEFTGAVAIMPEVLESHLASGSYDVESDPAVRAAGARAGAQAFTQLVVCVDPSGKPGAVTITQPPSYNDFARAVAAVAKRWTFRPFVLHGEAVRVCAIDVIGHGQDHARRSAPWAWRSAPQLDSGGGTREVEQATLDAVHIAGDRALVPDSLIKHEIAGSGAHRIAGMFRVCATADGVVGSVEVMRSTGYDSYDLVIKRAMRAWRYAAFSVDPSTRWICSLVTMVYAQR